MLRGTRHVKLIEDFNKLWERLIELSNKGIPDVRLAIYTNTETMIVLLFWILFYLFLFSENNGNHCYRIVQVSTQALSVLRFWRNNDTYD